MFKQILKNIILAIAVSMGVISTCSALEVDYPAFGSFAAPTTTTTLLPYVSYVFGFAIFIAGLIVFGAMIYGGMKYLTSAGNVGASSDAKDRIFSAIIGLAILLLSFLGLSLINVSVTKIELTPLQKEGVTIKFDNGSEKVYSSSVSKFPDGLKVAAISFDENKYKVYFYFQDGMQGDRNSVTPGVVGDDPKSMAINYTNDGVQLCFIDGGRTPCEFIGQSTPNFGSNDDKYTQIIIKDKKDSSGNVTLKYWAIVFEKQSYGFGKLKIYDSEGVHKLVETGSPWASSIKIFSYIPDPDSKRPGMVKVYNKKNLTGEFDVASNDKSGTWRPLTNTNDENWSIEITGSRKGVLCENADADPEGFRGRCQLIEKTAPNLSGYEIGRCRMDWWVQKPCASSFIVLRGDN
ncbi:MAG: hypothetical protein WC397_01990 [Candidatus Paceibacterota bacterium]|jgi:hypothetical protein